MRARLALIVVYLAAMLLLCACAYRDDNKPANTDAVTTAAPTVAPTVTPKVDNVEYKKITAEQAKARIEENKAAIIVDVRTLSEFEEKHIPGAVLIPNETIIDKPPEALPDYNAEILVYCRTGNRSRQASEKLIAMGYKNVYDFGGIADWPYETVSGS